MKSTPEMRARVRELATVGDDYDRAVLAILDDIAALLAAGECAPSGEPSEEAINKSFEFLNMRLCEFGDKAEMRNLLCAAYAIDFPASPAAPAPASDGWEPIESAPKGYPSLEEPSEWFIAIGKNSGPKGAGFAIIRRVFGHGFGPREGTGDEYYCADFFTHWQPLPTAPVEKE